MEVIAGLALLSSGYYLNKNDKTLRSSRKSKLNGGDPDMAPSSSPVSAPGPSPSIMGSRFLGAEPRVNLTPTGLVEANLPADNQKIAKAFKINFFKKSTITNPAYKENAIFDNIDQQAIQKIKSNVNLDKKVVETNLNDVGFKSANQLSYDQQGGFESLPSIDDIERDVQLTHNNMTPFFGSTVTQNVNDNGATAAILENYTGNFRHTRRDNKQEVEYLFDPDPNNSLVYGASTEMATNRDPTRHFPSATGKKHNDLPFEQIRVGKGVANGYTARPSGGFHQDVRILPKTTEELRVNPKITYESRVIPGKFPTEKGKLIGQQSLKKPKAIMYNWNGERNFTTTGAHIKNKQRPDIIFKSTNKDKLHCEYTGIAAPTTKSKNTPESLRGKKKLSNKMNFLNTPYRNLTQATGKRMNDLGKTSFWNKPTERSMQSARVHYTNVNQQGRMGQQYIHDGPKYTRKQDLIYNRPTGGEEVSGKSGPHRSTSGPVYDPTQTARTTIRETMEDNLHDGFMGHKRYRGQVYDQNQTAKTTVRETTEDNLHQGWLGKHKLKGKVYNQNETAKTTVRETTEDNMHDGWVGYHARKGKAYDQSEIARTTIRETTEDNLHDGWVGYHARKGKAYDQSEIARTTIRETTEDNMHDGWVGKHKHKGKVYNQNDTARVTIRETTEDNNYIPSINSAVLQRGGGYATTTWEAKNPQKAYLCNHEYVGGGEATTNKRPKTYDAEYRVNTNKEQIAVGRAPNQVGNSIAAGKEAHNIIINKLELDREVPHIMHKGGSIGNMYNPYRHLTSTKNVTPTQIDRLQADVLDQVKFNPLHINLNLN